MCCVQVQNGLSFSVNPSGILIKTQQAVSTLKNIEIMLKEMECEHVKWILSC